MGTDSDLGWPDEKPAHRVRVDGFWMDETDVTNSQFRAFVEATGYVTTAEKPVDAAEILKQSCRLSDTIVRYGGDEFLMLLSGSSEVDADRVIARIQERADAWNKQGSIAGCVLGLSCGFARYTRGASVKPPTDRPLAD